MLHTDRDALECDLAETYHIYDMKELPLRKAALFSVGLRDNARIKMKLANVKYELKDILLMSIADRLSILAWQNTKDAQDGKNKPKMLVNTLLGIETDDEISSFKSGAEFEKARNEIRERTGQ